MLTRLFSRASSRRHVPDDPEFHDVPDFPERADLPHLSDQEAGATLALLRFLVAQHQATVYTRPYTPEGERAHLNVGVTTAGNGRRVELEPWAMNVRSPYSPAIRDDQPAEVLPRDCVPDRFHARQGLGQHLSQDTR